MSDTKMTVTAKKTVTGGKTYYEGIVNLPNLTTTKLRKSDGSTLYGAVANLRQAADLVAEKYFMVLNFVNPTTKVAAKKSSSR